MIILEELKGALKKGGGYIYENSANLLAYTKMLADNIKTEEEKKYMNMVNLSILNLKNIDNKVIYRGVNVKYLKNRKNRKIDNYTNSLSEAKIYSEGVLLEYEYGYDDSNIKEEPIEDRKEGIVQVYDKEIKKRELDGFRWYVGLGEYYYRIKNSSTILKKIYYIGDSSSENVANFVLGTRAYLGVSQKVFAGMLGIRQSKVSEYENAKRDIGIDMIVKISKLVDISQTIIYNNTNINLANEFS